MLTNENMQHFVLIDDSDVWLNHHSELLMKSDFTRERKVSLKGEAYFDVEADKNNPFIIELEGDNFIKVIGTSFNVINRPDKFDLTVYSGTVEFHALKRVIVLEKGERITSINGTYTKIRNQDLNTLSWKTKELVFDNSPLLKAFSELENHYNVKFEINPDLDLTSCKLRSKFNDETLGQVLNELKLIFNMEYFETDTHVQIQQLNCN
jgi:ferric-dicitrate binding protein FerR (iron transport regulator)